MLLPYNKGLPYVMSLFFELIRVATRRQERLSRMPSTEEWQELYSMAETHALLGVCFSGIRQLEQQGLHIPKGLYYQWLTIAAQIQQRNEMLNKQCFAACSKVEKAGFKACVLKGQGIAQLYGPELAMLRQCGDIDLWVDGGMKNALIWAREQYGNVRFDYINAHLPMFKRTEVELHYRASFMTNLIENRKLQRWLIRHEQELTCSKVELPNGIGKIPVPSLSFNIYYVLLHCYNHMFSEGLGLRQIMDLYFVLVQGSCVPMEVSSQRSSEKLKKIVNEDYKGFFLKELELYKFASAMMWILGYVFEMNRETMICEPDENEGRYILEEILQNGNFGHYDKRVKNIKGRYRAKVLARIVQHNSHLAKHYPSKLYWNLIWLCWHFIWKRSQICVSTQLLLRS